MREEDRKRQLRKDFYVLVFMGEKYLAGNLDNTLQMYFKHFAFHEPTFLNKAVS